MKEFWIKKGTNGFTYAVMKNDDSGDTYRTLKGDQYYDAVLEEPIDGGLHVIEKSAYDRLKSELAAVKKERDVWADAMVENARLRAKLAPYEKLTDVVRINMFKWQEVAPYTYLLVEEALAAIDAAEGVRDGED